MPPCEEQITEKPATRRNSRRKKYSKGARPPPAFARSRGHPRSVPRRIHPNTASPDHAVVRAAACPCGASAALRRVGRWRGMPARAQTLHRQRGPPGKCRRHKPAGRNPQPPDRRHGTHDRARPLPPIPAGGAPLVAHPGAPATPFTPPAVQDHADAADRPERPLDLGDQEGPIARDDRIARAQGKVAPRALGADAVRDLGVSRPPLRDDRAAPRADGPHRGGCYPRGRRSAKHFSRRPQDLSGSRSRAAPFPSPDKHLGNEAIGRPGTQGFPVAESPDCLPACPTCPAPPCSSRPALLPWFLG